MKSWHAAAVFGLAASHALPAAAQLNTAAGGQREYALSRVRAKGAEQCPDRRALAREIERRLGRSVFAAEVPRSLEVQVSRTGATLTSTVASPPSL